MNSEFQPAEIKKPKRRKNIVSNTELYGTIGTNNESNCSGENKVRERHVYYHAWFKNDITVQKNNIQDSFFVINYL